MPHRAASAFGARPRLPKLSLFPDVPAHQLGLDTHASSRGRRPRPRVRRGSAEPRWWPRLPPAPTPGAARARPVAATPSPSRTWTARPPDRQSCLRCAARLGEPPLVPAAAPPVAAAPSPSRGLVETVRAAPLFLTSSVRRLVTLPLSLGSLSPSACEGMHPRKGVTLGAALAKRVVDCTVNEPYWSPVTVCGFQPFRPSQICRNMLTTQNLLTL